MSQLVNIPSLGANKHTGDHGFLAAPKLTSEQAGFDQILSNITSGTPFHFCTLPSSFWTALAKERNQPIAQRPARAAAIDERQSGLSENDFVGDILAWFQRSTKLNSQQIVVPNRSLCPGPNEVDSATWDDIKLCERLISECVSPNYIKDIAALGLSGHEMTIAMITGTMRRLLDSLRDRVVIVVAKAGHEPFVDAITCKDLVYIHADASVTETCAEPIKDRLLEAVRSCGQTEQLPPVVLSSVGGAFSTWLGIQLWDCGADVQYLDLGEALNPIDSPQRPADWAVLYQHQLSRGLARVLGLHHDTPQTLRGKTGIRQADLVSLASAHGVPQPLSVGEIPSPMPQRPLPFIENKIYDHSRIDDYLSLSVQRNHHANGGPVANLLEEVVAAVAGLPANREVVAVSNGTSALHLATAIHAPSQPQMRWVSSAFNFFSCGIGHLSNTRILDCDLNGRFDLEALKALPVSSYDGVIYTNVFAQQTDWDAVADFCRENGKAFVVDNATGLFDRPSSAFAEDAPIETISAHHTKPWGVGEGGFVICNKDQAQVIRKFMNFGASLSVEATPWATNAKLSDLAAAAILDRLERLDYWARFYKSQERRMRFIAQESDRGVTEFGNPTPIRSPRAHTPFLAPHPVDVAHPLAAGPVTIQKYYKPMRTIGSCAVPTPNAEDLFKRVFCLSNAPEMRMVSNEEIIEQVRRLIDAD